MQLFYCPAIRDINSHLDPEESRHCLKVLRKRPGDQIHITDGKGTIYTARIKELNINKCTFTVISKEHISKPKVDLHIAIAPTKSLDRTEWFLEKAVEIGVQKITFIQTRFSERKSIKTERIRKKAISAMKQSTRAYLPEILDMVKLNTIAEASLEKQKYVAHLEEEYTHHLKDLANTSNDVMILIGPEGGFSDEEIVLLKSNDFKSVRLGDYRLRTETAGIVACAIVANLNA